MKILCTQLRTVLIVLICVLWCVHSRLFFLVWFRTRTAVKTNVLDFILSGGPDAFLHRGLLVCSILSNGVPEPSWVTRSFEIAEMWVDYLRPAGRPLICNGTYQRYFVGFTASVKQTQNAFAPGAKQGLPWLVAILPLRKPRSSSEPD